MEVLKVVFRRPRGRWLSLPLAALVGLLLALPAAADDTGAVPGSVTVEASNACILVEGSYDFGTLPFAAPGQTFSAQAATAANITSCGSGDQDIFVRGTDAIGGSAAWSLNPSVVTAPCQADNYGLLATDLVRPGAHLSTIDTLWVPLGANAAIATHGIIVMPCQGSSGAGQLMSFSVVYTAVLGETPSDQSELEPNDSLAQANPLNASSGSAIMYGTIASDRDNDFFRLDATGFAGPQDVDIETFDGSASNTCSADTLLWVYDSAGLVIASDDNSGVANCSSIQLMLEPGIYHVRVGAASGSSAGWDYRLSVTILP